MTYIEAAVLIGQENVKKLELRIIDVSHFIFWEMGVCK